MHGHALPDLLWALRALLAVVCVSTIGFYAWGACATREFFARRAPERHRDASSAVSVLKPVRGLDPDAAENFASFFVQEYPEWEILFGAEEQDDAGLEAARRVARRYPDFPARFIVGNGMPGTNPKVRILSRLAREARHPVLLISDSDIRVDRFHLERMAEPLRDPEIGVVTCLYRTGAENFWGRLDSLALATEFVPGALVARKLEGMSFAMGAGILIRRDVLDRIGGFRDIADCLADDYLLGNLPARAGYRVELAREIVDHRLGTNGLTDLVWRQIRWNLGIRTSRPWSYAGLLLMQGTAAAAALSFVARGSLVLCSLAAATWVVRLCVAWYVAVRCMKDRSVGRYLWLVPIRDLLSTVLWIASFASHKVVWRGKRFRVERGGRLTDLPA